MDENYDQSQLKSLNEINKQQEKKLTLNAFL